MLNSNHPDDTRLSALASADADAVGDSSLKSHVDSCAHCTTLVEELGALRGHLAALPDIAPSRPLRLVPDAPATPDRLGIWVRKVFGPVMAAGAALALVGMIGTVGPSMYQSAGSDSQRLSAASAAAAPEVTSGRPAVGGVDSFSSDGESYDFDGDGRTLEGEAGAEAPDPEESSDESSALRSEAERSPWPMVLVAGVAVLVAGALLRWILVPRAG